MRFSTEFNGSAHYKNTPRPTGIFQHILGFSLIIPAKWGIKLTFFT